MLVRAGDAHDVAVAVGPDGGEAAAAELEESNRLVKIDDAIGGEESASTSVRVAEAVEHGLEGAALTFSSLRLARMATGAVAVEAVTLVPAAVSRVRVRGFIDADE